jgi:hypothetical protein
MTLENLVGKTLDRHECTPADVARLVASVQRNLSDADVAGLSATSRFDIAYKAIMQCGLLALHANGFRPLTSAPGHHMTIIQSLTQTIGLPAERVAVLDKLRRMRNANDYSGDGVSSEETDACARAARSLLKDVQAWLKRNRPDLLSDDR